MEKFKFARFFVISDIDPSDFLINCKYNVEIVNETDIDQFYVGLQCNHFIIGESTFHYWIALLKTIKDPKSKVYVFNNTDITNRNLNKYLNWNVVDKVDDGFIYLPLQDQSKNDIFRKEFSVPILKELAINDKDCVGFNTMGFFKNKITSITPLIDFGPNEGIYIKKCNSNVCFIHSCTIENTKRLDYLIDKIPFDLFSIVFINNIGKPIFYNNPKIVITNYSEDIRLFEVPTINKLHSFSLNNKGFNILYLHTKGVTNQSIEVNDWIDMMLYFLINQNALDKLKNVDTVGCNYINDGFPPHWSGNFWWAKSNYIAKLPKCKKEYHEPEFWLHQLNPTFFELHNSGVNHYHSRYPIENYC